MPASKRYCLKSYCKDRAWKQVIQWFAIGATSILFLGTFAVCDAYAAGGTVDIQGLTKATGLHHDEAGLEFDADPGTGNFENYSARIYSSGNYENGQPDNFELRGWVWNPQFGWISLYCGADGKNQGINCGNIEYGVKVNLQDDGRMYGWAWGDNIGWLSFDCQGTQNDTFSCGNSTYGSYLGLEIDTNLGTVEALDGTAAHLSREPMAWADTVGKFNLNGIGSKILALMIKAENNETSAGVWTKVENLNGGDRDTPPSKSNMPSADGTEGYDLFINVADILGNPVDPSYVSITTTYDNRIQRNQTINDTSLANLDAYKKTTWIPSGLATSQGITGAYHQKITSVAPTDEGNCYDPDDDGCDFYYKEFADENETIQPQKLEYEGGEVIVGNATIGFVTINLSPPFVTSTIENLEFVAPIEIDTLGFVLPGYTNPIDVIQATRNAIDTFNITAVKHGTPSADAVILELTSLEEDVDYKFIDSIDDNPFTDGINPKILAQSLIADLANNEIYAIPFTPDVQSSENLSDLVAGAELRSTIFIDVPGDDVFYHNNGLPRTDDSEIINQTVEILSGSVFSPGAIKASSEADVTLYGDAAVYEARTSVLKDVSDLIRGTTITGGGEMTINASINEFELAENSLKNGRVYFFENTDVHLESIKALVDLAPSADSPISIIVRGGDLYVDGNINESGDPAPIGLIVLESNIDTDEATKGGHIYVHGDVTDMVEVSIFADGPLFRYVDDVCFNSTDGLREPNFVDGSYGCDANPPGGYEEPISSNPNQFYLKGNVATLNCLGCSVSANPTRGDGTLIDGGPTAKNFAIARLYDFNYFSYFRLHPISGDLSGSLAANVPASATVNRPVYIEYSPAPSNLFGFRSF